MKKAAVPLLAASAYLLSAGAAPAADLGGNCCADLEERVAELEATTARKGNRRMSLTVSGQVNTAIMVWDQGEDNAVFIVDNGVSRSGFNFDGTAKIRPDLTAGFQMVIGLATGARSHQTNQFDDDGGAVGDGTLGVELANWFLRDDRLGELRVGRINSASSGTTIVDLGGAGVIANANILLWAGGFFLSSENIPAGTVVDARWSTLMGGNTVGISSLSRQNAVSYTTPTWSGFSFQIAGGEQDAIDDGMWDAALRYAGEFGGFRFAAAVSYGRNAGNTTDAEDNTGTLGSTVQPFFGNGADLRKWQGSASLLHVSSGLYLTGAFVNQSYHGDSQGDLVNNNPDVNRPDTKMWYAQAGVSRNWTGLGRTVLYGEYANIDDGAAGLRLGFDSVNNDWLLVNSSDMTMWGVGVVQHIDAAAMELYLAFRQYQGDINATEFIGGVAGASGNVNVDDLNVVMGGARVRF